MVQNGARCPLGVHALNLFWDCPCANACCMVGSTTSRVAISPNAATIAKIASVVLLFIFSVTKDN